MIHNEVESGGHYAVAQEAQGHGILVQLGEKEGTQARVLLTKEETHHLTKLLQQALLAKDWRWYGGGTENAPEGQK